MIIHRAVNPTIFDIVTAKSPVVRSPSVAQDKSTYRKALVSVSIVDPTDLTKYMLTARVARLNRPEIMAINFDEIREHC